MSNESIPLSDATPDKLRAMAERSRADAYKERLEALERTVLEAIENAEQEIGPVAPFPCLIAQSAVRDILLDIRKAINPDDPYFVLYRIAKKSKLSPGGYHGLVENYDPETGEWKAIKT